MPLILVIEDQEDACGLVRRLLMRLGHTVVCLEHGSEADLWLKSHQPDLVIVGGGRHGELASDRLEVLARHGVSGSRVLLGCRADALEFLRGRFGQRVREIFSSPQALESLEAMVRKALDETPAAKTPEENKGEGPRAPERSY